MIPLRRIPLLAAFLFTCTTAGFAQKFCDVAPPSPYKHNALIVTGFDSATRKVKTTLEHPRPMGGGIYLYASFFQQDRRLSTGPIIEIVFSSVSKEKYRDSHSVGFIADGQAWPVISQTQYFTDTDDEGHKIEKTRLMLTRESLVELLKSRKVKARLGLTEFELSNNHLESLRELASRMGGPRRSNLAMR
jgi:hypothetical protein